MDASTAGSLMPSSAALARLTAVAASEPASRASTCAKDRWVTMSANRRMGDVKLAYAQIPKSK